MVAVVVGNVTFFAINAVVVNVNTRTLDVRLRVDVLNLDMVLPYVAIVLHEDLKHLLEVVTMVI